MTNHLKNICKNAKTLALGGTLGGVGIFTKEKLLELNWINLEKRERFFDVV